MKGSFLGFCYFQIQDWDRKVEHYPVDWIVLFFDLICNTLQFYSPLSLYTHVTNGTENGILTAV